MQFMVMRFFCFLMAAMLPAVHVLAQEASTDSNERLDSVVVSSTRAGFHTPVTYSSMDRGRLRRADLSSSVPMTLGLMPSVVSSNEGGTGLGNSKLTIRGVKGSQINVTLNGITLNDSESQEVFWVNIPALTSILSSVQVQRGLGTSANGSGAFGASINMNTAFVEADPSGRFEASAGSYGTAITTVSASTGLLKGGFYASAAVSRGRTDGYIRRADANVGSAFAVLGWLSGRNSLRLTYLMGKQKTGITWNGIGLDDYAKDRRYNSAGEYKDKYGNHRYYPGETDNYAQHHVQLNYSRAFSPRLSWTTTVNYTRGDGYDEYYKSDKTFTAYGFDPSVSETAGGDFIIRKQMSNDYWVLSSDLGYHGRRLDVTGGVYGGYYMGRHFGKVLWSDVLGDSFDYSPRFPNDKDNQWYFYGGNKLDMNVFVRAEALILPWLTGYADLQYRHVGYVVSGVSDIAARLDYGKPWDFFNPRGGLTAAWGRGHRAYLSAAWGNREPGKSDIKEVLESVYFGGENSELKPESMLDLEAGYGYYSKKFSVSANIYMMEYRNMLLETGRLSSSGFPVKDNVSRAYRRGVELEAGWHPAAWLSVMGNMTLSINRIPVYDDSAPVIDNTGENGWNELGYSVVYKSFTNTPILLSPSTIGMAGLSFRPWAGRTSSLGTTAFTISGKWVGKQYLDNTGDDSRMAPGRFTADFTASHEFTVKGGKIGLSAYLYNIFNKLYYADGGAWKNFVKETGEVVSGVYVYPQAPFNFMFKVYYAF